MRIGDMKDRTCLVTGGNSGVGKAIALGLAKLGSKVVILCRDRTRGSLAAEEIRSKSGNNNVDLALADLSVMSSIREFVDYFKQNYDGLNVLSNNAAAFPMKREVTADGFEKIFAVTYLGHFLLTNLLLDMLKASAPARIITVNGNPGILKKQRVRFEDIQFENNFSPFKAVLHTAFLKMVFTFELANRLGGTGITANTFFPGLIKSNLARNFPWYIKPFIKFSELFFSKQSKTGVYLASSQEVEKTSGMFFRNCVPVNSEAKHYDRNVGQELWELSEKLCGIK
jgi:NAD(P)-dependent dehydrogenase (short-subunit alcohol dehydrogenase family)